MNTTNNKITLKQYVFLLVLDVFSTTFLILPKVLYESSENSGFIFIIISSVITLLLSTIYVQIFLRSNCQTFSDLLYKYLGKLSTIIIFLFIIKNVLFVMYLLTYFITLVEVILLSKYNFIILSTIFMVSIYFFTIRGIEIRGRLAEVTFPILFIFLVLFFVIASQDISLRNILPITILEMDKPSITKSMLISQIAFSGFEYSFVLAPYFISHKKMQRANFFAISLLMLLFVTIQVFTTSLFNKQMLIEEYPVLLLLNSISLPLDFIERQDALVFTVWIISSFFTVSSGIFYSNLLLVEQGIKNKSNLYLLNISVLVGSILIHSFFDIDRFAKFVFSFNVLFFVSIPIILLILYLPNKFFTSHKRAVSLLLVFALSTTLTSCVSSDKNNTSFSNGVGFVEKIYVDYKDDNVVLTLNVIDLSNYTDMNNSERRNIVSEGKTVLQAVKNVNLYTNEKLEFMHTREIYVNQNFYKEKKHMTDLLLTINSHNEISRKISLFTTKLKYSDIERLSKSEVINRTNYPKTISDVFYQSVNYGETLISNLTIKNDVLSVDDATFFVDYEYLGIVNSNKTKSYNYLTLQSQENEYLSDGIVIKDYKTKEKFTKSKYEDVIYYNLDITMYVDDFKAEYKNKDNGDNNYSNLSDSLKNELLMGYDYFNSVSYLILNIPEKLKKEDYSLYKEAYANNITIRPKINIKIKKIAK